MNDLFSSSLKRVMVGWLVLGWVVVGGATPVEVVVHGWDFRRGEAGVEDWVEGWKRDTRAAEAEKAMWLDISPQKASARLGALYLEDVYDSGAEGGTDRDGTPQISLSFAPIRQGSLSFRAGTAGTQNQQGIITLLARGRPLMLVRLTSNTEGVVASASGEVSFRDVSWFNRARDYAITWVRQGDGTYAVTMTFQPLEGELVVFEPLRFLAPGAPDEVRMQVGFGRAVEKSLRIETFFLTELR